MNMIICLFIAAYILVGIFVATLADRIIDNGSGDSFVLAMFLWPILIIGLIMFAILAIPYKLANWICDAVERRKEK